MKNVERKKELISESDVWSICEGSKPVLVFKGTESAILSDSPFQDANSRFTTVPLIITYLIKYELDKHGLFL